MKVSDYLVRLLEENGITHVFGIPGVGCGHFMNSMIGSGITNHLVYNEQGAAFAACGYAQASHKVGMAYTTAGPGGTNLVTGIANAYADSIPTLFLVGEKDLAELKRDLKVRQRASQEVDIVNIAVPVTKWSCQVTRKEEVRYVFEKALHLAKTGRPGPVLIDLPSDIARAEIDVDSLEKYVPDAAAGDISGILPEIVNALEASESPLLLAGNAIRQEELEQDVIKFAEELQVPIVSTLVTCDAFTGVENYLGYIGMDGDPAANAAVDKCDLLVTLGARLNFKQIGYDRAKFAPNAKIIRIDIDPGELEYSLDGSETAVCADVKNIVPGLLESVTDLTKRGDDWLAQCIAGKSSSKKKGSKNPKGDAIMAAISSGFPDNARIAVDTGSHRRWLISQMKYAGTQKVYQSAGLASMGYALPAAIGIWYASRKPTICINGDGGIMMNLQELQLISRENLPVTVFVFNNHALGDIMEFQKRVFDKQYFATTEGSGYQAADYEGLAGAFHFHYLRIEGLNGIDKISYTQHGPQLIEVVVPSNE